MTYLRTLFASLAFATVAACAVGHHQPATKIAQPEQIQPADKIKSIDRAKLRAKLAERRAAVVDRFLAYREARIYPVNALPGGGFRHVWLDDSGNLCAAATLISLDWGRDAAIRVGAANVEIKMADATGELADWILTSGLTRAEIVAIQLPGDNINNWRDNPQVEITRMHGVYMDVERQIRSLWDANLDLAVDALMKRPELARAMLDGKLAGPGRFAQQPVG
jgi:hypothetical protein